MGKTWQSRAIDPFAAIRHAKYYLAVQLNAAVLPNWQHGSAEPTELQFLSFKRNIYVGAHWRS